MSNKQKLEIGEEVKVYLVSGTVRMKLTCIYNTPVEQVKLYELQDEQGNFHYVTRQFIGKVD